MTNTLKKNTFPCEEFVKKEKKIKEEDVGILTERK